jgi:tetrahydromethanopterin S-methyltransferase subunit G|tara:strand:- start:43 stop:267 length:225 start_codon:yes stop_codon:yes gene_type:complete
MADDIMRLSEIERTGIENRAKISAAKDDLGQAYRRIEKIEEKLDRLGSKVVQMGALSAVAIPLVTAFLINLLSQ